MTNFLLSIASFNEAVKPTAIPAWLTHHRVMLLLGLISAVLGCKTKSDESVLPGVSRIEVVSDAVRRVFLMEDLANARITLRVIYYDANNSVVANNTAQPQFFVNGKPLPGNTYTFDQPGEYRFSAKIGILEATDRLGAFLVSRASDYLSQIVLRTSVGFVNADSVSRLPLTYDVSDKRGNRLYVEDQIKLYADGKPYPVNNSFSSAQAGQHTLQAELFGIRSNSVTVVARKPVPYELIRIPVIIHYPKGLNVTPVDPDVILARVNDKFRKRLSTTDPNQADAYIEFVPVREGPDGQALAIAGLNQLDFAKPKMTAAALHKADSVVRAWCPRQYINVFVDVDWEDTYGNGYSYTVFPGLSSTPNRTDCADLPVSAFGADQLPAINIFDASSFEVLAHELGHFLGLFHTFANTCAGGYQVLSVADAPKHDQARNDANGFKYTCDKTPFVSNYVMDYFVPQLSFTAEQVAIMRTVVDNGEYIPTSSVRGGRRKAGDRVPTIMLPKVGLIACPSQ